MMRRKIFLAFVACFLLLSQQAAVLHAISHLKSGTRALSTVPGLVAETNAQAASEFCLECEAFAQVATAASDTPIAKPTVAVPAVAIVVQAQHSQDAAVLPPFLARAPPIVL
jgi:hypothetical protein